MVLAAACAGAGALAGAALASPGWSTPSDFALPAKEPGSLGQTGYQIAYQVGGIATIAYIEIISLAPLQTVLHAGVLPPGGPYQEQLRIASTAGSIPAEAKLAETPSGAAVLQWSVLEGSEPETSPLAYLASYRAAGSNAWEAPATIATDVTRKKNISDTLVPAISTNGTAAAGVEHLDPSMPSGGYRADVAIHSPGGTWGAPTQVSPANDSIENMSLALGFDASGDLTAAFRKELAKERDTLDAVRRPASSGVWGSLEDVTGEDITSDAYGPALGVAPDGSAAIAFQYVHYTGSKTLDVNLVTRYSATGSWTAPFDASPGGASSGPMAIGISSTDQAYVLYSFQGTSSGEDCVGAIRSFAGSNFATSPHCVSPTNFNPGFGGVAFLGNDAYFAWSGQPNGGESYVAEGSRWLEGSPTPDSFTDLDAPAKSIRLEQVVADDDGSVAAFWNAEVLPGEHVLRAAAFDAGPPNLLGAAVPASAVASQPVAMSASFADLWSGLGEPPSWSFGDGTSTSGAQVSHIYAAPGIYTVTVRAQDGLGNATSSTYSITVAPAAPVSPPGPMLKLMGSKVVGQSVVLQLACTGAPCTGVAKLITREKLSSGKLVAVQSRHGKARMTYKTVTVGVAHFTIAPGRMLSVTMALNATGRGLLARFKKLPVSLTIAPSSAIPVKHFTILPPKRRAKHKKR